MKEEGKFRQRVDDHYRVMAAAKKTIGTAGRLQLAGALGMGTAMGVAATLPETGSMVAAGVSFVLMLHPPTSSTKSGSRVYQWLLRRGRSPDSQARFQSRS